MKVKTLIFFFVLITLALAQQKIPKFGNFFGNKEDDQEDNNNQQGQTNPPGQTNQPGQPNQPIQGQGGQNQEGGNNNGQQGQGDGQSTKTVNGNQNGNPFGDPNAPKPPFPDPNNPMGNPFSTGVPEVSTTATVAETTPAVFTTKQIVSTVAPAPKPSATNNDATPVPTVNLTAQTALHANQDGLPWGKILMFVGIGVAALFVVGIVFNFINKAKSKNDNLDLNYGIDQAQPEMSTSMFPPQSNTYNNNYQYGQYGTDNQYNQPSNSYGQNYGQDVNFAQRTLSLNRNPAANQQNYQMDQNAREVIYNHRPEAGDEIELRCGDQATIYEKYEDGWAWGYNITTGKTGMFPQQCLA